MHVLTRFSVKGDTVIQTYEDLHENREAGPDNEAAGVKNSQKPPYMNVFEGFGNSVSIFIPIFHAENYLTNEKRIGIADAFSFIYDP